ncbi:BMP family ABC transporter substrate-binding protein [Acrocarpospora corrugata]|uniref:BMP family ABC transporter substrate-binding protein n=1 Tax=Acrocarpospora corrugata TaxID=35763 RepID=A0A5M3W804_9ACTN|nr:BMP family ABC transporter substrate-binding protein [Acrocarpospora corrugata]GES04479.1 BMP family ABC transporter substrate-binding protein [Acrocarpospora corrugata]
MKALHLAALLVVPVMVVTGCGGDGSATATGTNSQVAIKPGVVTDIGGLGDHGFNDLASTGLKVAEKNLGAEGRVLVPQTPADYANNLNQLAQSGFQPVFGIGFTFTDAITAAAKQFPNTHFGIIDSVVEAPNVTSLVFREEEGSYLTGVVAGLMTQVKTDYTNPADKVVGFIGGQESPLIEKFGAGYKQGVLSVCPDCQVLYQYVGTTTQAFSDPGTGSEIASNMHSKGADVIYHAAGASGDGLFKVAQDQKFFAIGVNVDQAQTNPNAPVLTSVLKRVDTAVTSTIEAQTKGTWKAGVQSFGLSNQGIALAPFGKFDSVVPESVKTAVADAQQKIVDGSLKAATTLAEVGGK